MIDETELQKKYTILKNKAIEFLDCQQAYFRSNKNYSLLTKSKAVEAELKELINPKPKIQQQLFNEEFLGL